MKKIVAFIVMSCALFSSLGAVELNGFADDFKAIMTGVTRDVAPNLQMIALSGNIVGDAKIDRFMFYLPTPAVTIDDGIGSILVPGARTWSLISFPEYIEKKLGKGSSSVDIMNALESNIMAYPTFKMGVGVGFAQDYDVIVTGMILPKFVSETALKQAGDKIAKNGISFDALNLGVELRRSILKDEGKIPAVSLGVLYSYGGFNLNMDSFTLSNLIGDIDVYSQKLDMTGSINASAASHNFGFDLHASKHLSIFMPYVKYTGVYQYSRIATETKLKAALGNSITINIDGQPDVVIQDFASLLTMGYEINCFIFILNTNVAVDLGRAKLSISDFSLTGISGRGITLNTGIRWQF